MNDKKTTRRRFLVAAITLSGCASATISPSILRISSAWAESGGNPDMETMAAMVRMARLLFPHETMSDDFYAGVLDSALSATASDSSFAELLTAANDALDSTQSGRWIDLDEEQQLAVMRQVEARGFFAAIQGAVRAGIYLNPVFWEHIGYPGSSKEFGGYINRGFDDIDWLPEDL
jgi:hypothetical protein